MDIKKKNKQERKQTKEEPLIFALQNNRKFAPQNRQVYFALPFVSKKPIVEQNRPDAGMSRESDWNI
jgi:hypothetical protein